MKKKLLWIGDAVQSTGFAKCTHKTLEAFHPDWDVYVLGLNYMGDPHPYPYPIYPCRYMGPMGDLRGDSFGLQRCGELVKKIKPDVVIVQNDPWNIPEYRKALGNTPTIAAMAVDGKNCKFGKQLNGLAGAVLWTQFGFQQVREGGYFGPAAVIPLGVDLNLFKPGDKRAARERLGRACGMDLQDVYIVGSTNRNQPRKRWDLTVEYFAEWVHKHKINDAYLFLHAAPTGDKGYDIADLMNYYNLPMRLILSEPPIGMGAREDFLVATYSCFDVQISTTQGEGWGLTTMEGMACGIPQIVPDWSALGEWAKPAAILVPCSTTAVTVNTVNVFGGVPDKAPFVSALHNAYTQDTVLRERWVDRGLALVQEDQFRWENIGVKFRGFVEESLYPVSMKEMELAVD